VDVDLKKYGHSLEKRLGADPGVTRILIQKARVRPCRVLFPEAENPTVLRACRLLADEKIARPVLLGNAQEIRARARLNTMVLRSHSGFRPRPGGCLVPTQRRPLRT
jgi:hypothetical protein